MKHIQPFENIKSNILTMNEFRKYDDKIEVDPLNLETIDEINLKNNNLKICIADDKHLYVADNNKIYNLKNIINKLKSYEFQKRLAEEYPENLLNITEDLGIEINPKIKAEFHM